MTSIASPMMNNPGMDLASNVLEDISFVSTPPIVTSAFAKPSVPLGIIVHEFIKSAISFSFLFERTDKFPG